MTLTDFRSPEWIWRFMIAVGIIIQLWLNSHYISRAEYFESRKESTRILDSINKTLAEVRLSIELLKFGSAQLSDHEIRIRVLETKVK